LAFFVLVFASGAQGHTNASVNINQYHPKTTPHQHQEQRSQHPNNNEDKEKKKKKERKAEKKIVNFNTCSNPH
jgi:hypothetical protein